MDVINLSLGEPEIEPRARPRRRCDRRRREGGRRAHDRGRGQRVRGLRGRLGLVARQSPPGRSPRRRDEVGPDRAVLLGRAGARHARHEARRERAGRLDSLVRAVRGWGRGHRSAGRAWRRRTSPAQPPCSASAIPTGRWRRSSRRSSSPRTPRARRRGRGRCRSTREGGGLIYLPTANDPLVFAAPSCSRSASFASASRSLRTVALTDAGGGAGAWSVSVTVPGSDQGRHRDRSGVRERARALSRSGPAATAGATQADVTGFVVLTADGETRRIPFWVRTEQPTLGKPSAILRKAGIYKGNTRHGASRVRSYRYPEGPSRSANNFPGPEQVFRVVVPGRVSNFGVIVTGHAAGVTVSPRIVFRRRREPPGRRPGAPARHNPYHDSFGQPVPVVAVIAPASADATTSSSTRAAAPSRGRSPSGSGSTTAPRPRSSCSTPRRLRG